MGYLGLALSALLSATVIPFSSEAVLFAMLAYGYNPTGCIVVASLGNTTGGMISYGMGRIGHFHKIEKYFNVSFDRIKNEEERIAKYGAYIAFFTWLPIIGDVLAIALGFFCVSPLKTTIWMLTGKTLRYIIVVAFYFWI